MLKVLRNGINLQKKDSNEIQALNYQHACDGEPSQPNKRPKIEIYEMQEWLTRTPFNFYHFLLCLQCLVI